MRAPPWQEREKKKNRSKIITVLLKKPSTFTELLEETRLTRPTLANHLRSMKSTKDLVRVIDPETDKTVYRLTKKALSSDTHRRMLVSSLSEFFLDERVVDFYPNDREETIVYGKGYPVLSDREQLNFWMLRIGLLAVYTMLRSITLSRIGSSETGFEWFKETFMTEGQRKQIQYCMLTRLIGKNSDGTETEEYLKKIPEWKKGKPFDLVILGNELDYNSVPHERLSDMMRFLEELYPEEVSLLNKIYSKIFSERSDIKKKALWKSVKIGEPTA